MLLSGIILFAMGSGANAKYLDLKYAELEIRGEIYTDVTLMELNGDRVSFKHSRGVGNLVAGDFPRSVQQDMGFDRASFERVQKARTRETVAKSSNGGEEQSMLRQNWDKVMGGENVGFGEGSSKEQWIAYLSTFLICSFLIGILLHQLAKHQFEQTSSTWVAWVPGLQMLYIFTLSGTSLLWLFGPRILGVILSRTHDMLQNENVQPPLFLGFLILALLVYEGVLWFVVYRRICMELGRSTVFAILPAMPLTLATVFLFPADSIHFSVAEALFGWLPVVLWLGILVFSGDHEQTVEERRLEPLVKV